MATKRTVELELKIKGATTLDEMESNLAAINDELKQVDVNSEAFDDLSKAAQQATTQIDKTNEALEGVTSQQKAESAVKLSEGLVGGFQAAAAASAIFGDETSQAIQDATNQAASLFLAMDGLKKVTEAFSADNIKGYKAIIKGIKQSTIATKLFGTTTKAAIAATGIGLLVIAVGLLIANWEKVNKAVRDFADSIPFLKTVIDAFDDLNEQIGSMSNLLQAVGAALKAAFRFEDPIAAFKEALVTGRELEKVAEATAKAYEEGNGLLEDRIKLLEAEGNKEEEILKLQGDKLRLELNFLKTKQDITKEEKERIHDLELELKILEIKQKNLDDEVAAEKELKRLADSKTEAEKAAALAAAAALVAEKERKEIIDEALKAKQQEVVVADTLAKLIKDESKELDKQLDIDIEKARLARLLVQFRKDELVFLNASVFALDRGKDLISEWLLLNSEIQNVKAKNVIAEENLNKFLLENAGVTLDTLIANKQTFLQLGLTAEQLEELVELERERLFIQESAVFLEERRRDAIAGMITQAADLALQATDVVSEFLSAHISALNNELNDVGDSLAKLEKKLSKATDDRLDTEELLKDANGERFAELNEQYEVQVAQEDALQKQVDDGLKEQANLEYKLALARWQQEVIAGTQSVIQAAINTALGIIKAIPNPFLIAAAGILGGAMTAAVITNVSKLKGSKPKPPEGFAVGGYTAEASSDMTPVGVVHANEYVVPSDVLSSARGAEMVSVLESMRANAKGFADGGFTPAAIPEEAGGAGSLNIDQVVSAIENAQIFVSVQEIRDTQTNVEVIEQKASL